MRIIIAGAGEVGFHLARLLARESQDIYLIDENEERLEYARSQIDVFTVKGNAAALDVLKEASVKRADMFIAATSSEQTNLLTAMLAKKYGVKRTIARVQSQTYLKIDKDLNFEELGVDALFSPKEFASMEISRLIKHPAVTDSFEFAGGQLSMIGLILDEESPILNKTIIETAHLNPSLRFLPIAIRRNNKTIIPRGETVFRRKDHLYMTIQQNSMAELLRVTGKQNVSIKNVMILGGSQIGTMTASLLEKDYHVKLIEKNRNKCTQLTDRVPKTLIVNADARDVRALAEEGIAEMDAFIAVTGDSETNIISSLVAKNHGVKKTIALVENIDYINISQNIGIDTMINRKLIAANNIFRFIRKGEISALASIHGVNAEVIEFVVKPKSKITKKPIKDLNFPKDALIGGVVRDGKGSIVLGDFHVQPGDHVVVFTLPESIRKVERFFN